MHVCKKTKNRTPKMGLGVAVVLTIVTSLLVTSQARATVLAYWEFNEGSGYCADSSVGGYIGDLMGFADISAGVGDPVGGSGWTSDGMLNFDNTGARVETDFPLSTLADKSFTVEFIASHNNIASSWSTVTGRDSGSIFLVGKEALTGRPHANLDALDPGRTSLYSSTDCPINMADGNLHHVAAVFNDDTDTEELYIDHVLVGTMTGVTGTLDFSGNLWIGQDGVDTNLGWNGYIDSLRISEGALTTDDFLATPTPYVPITRPEGLAIDWNFNEDANGSFITDGQLIGNGIATYSTILSNPAELKNDAIDGSDYYLGGYACDSPHYATGTSVPDSQLPGFDDSALKTGTIANGDGHVAFLENQNSNFSIWQRVYREAETGTNEVISCRKGDWFIFVHGPTGTLEVNFASGNSANPLYDAFGGTGPEIAVGEWYDIGVTFEGVGTDSLEDVLKVYVNGELVRTFTTVATLGTQTPFVEIGEAGDWGLAFDGLYDRVMYWNEVIDAETMAELSGLTPDIPGDANGDGKVDGSDVTILAGNWQKGVGDGLTASWEDGDFNGDGKVDGSDVTILAGNWQAGTSTSAASVPEPSMFVLLFATLGSLAILRRVKK